MGKMNYDFSGYAAKYNVRCSDGTIIKPGAFKDQHGTTVPLVWNHNHSEIDGVIGHAILEDRKDGLYTYGCFNDTDTGKNAKILVQSGDITSMSIYANQLKHSNREIYHGVTREVSLVLAGADPTALIDYVVSHSENGEITEDLDKAVISFGELECDMSIEHGEINLNEGEPEKMEDEKKEEVLEHKDAEESKTDDDKTIGDVLNSMNEEQRKVVDYLVGKALEEGEKEENDNKDGGKEPEMKHNVFEKDEEVLEHNGISIDDLNEAIGDSKRFGSLKESFIQHGITNVGELFPDAKPVASGAPAFNTRKMEWVDDVMKAIHKTPFANVRSWFADLTDDDARALGYDEKGNFKKEEFFSIVKRVITPTTVYKKQKMHRDDILDITDFNVVAWLAQEMRMMLDEELARAFLIGDGRSAASDDKINETHIVPIYHDSDVYTIKKTVAFAAGDTDDAKAKKVIKAIIKSHKEYKGSGRPVLFASEDWITDMLLMEDSTGRVIYDTEEKLRTALRVSKIITVPVFEGVSRVDGATTKNLIAIMVNLNDYNVGTNAGGQVTMFDDFDIDYNAQKYLLETRCSGGLVKPFSAVVFEYAAS